MNPQTGRAERSSPHHPPLILAVTDHGAGNTANHCDERSGVRRSAGTAALSFHLISPLAPISGVSPHSGRSRAEHPTLILAVTDLGAGNTANPTATSAVEGGAPLAPQPSASISPVTTASSAAECGAPLAPQPSASLAPATTEPRGAYCGALLQPQPSAPLSPLQLVAMGDRLRANSH
ncbi:hypothetical protein CBR_g20046 [Chara braunii]|uniref:Uncharacterized protein n=1 Tax=Chara braunii TaxID=69332 RepID=A0A388KZD7_CHABU|nr:hypothetical protein CBR_g20046 [Chara braunii]|eukprot:GBG75416.1 hypothetical protein CBR_g20046 [Chara braunii]